MRSLGGYLPERDPRRDLLPAVFAAAIIKQPLYPVLKIDRFDAIESRLIGIVPVGFSRRRFIRLVLKRVAITRRRQRED